jgi:hypothetical protein
MRKPTTRLALRALGLIAAVSMVATACGDDDPIPPDREPETTTIVLTIIPPGGIGATARAVAWTTANGSVTPVNITIPAGYSQVVGAQFYRADQSIDPVVTPADFRLDFTATGGTGVTVTKNGNLAATITAGATAGQSVTYTLSLFHLGEGHLEYVSSPGALRVTVVTAQ